MINWNDQNQVGDTLWGDHKEMEDHIVPQPKEHNVDSFYKFESCTKKPRSEDGCSAISSTMETRKTKSNFLVCNAKYSSDSNTNRELNDATIDMDAWPDLPNLSMPFSGSFNEGVAQDSIMTGLVSGLADTSDLNSVESLMEGYNNSGGLLHDKDSSSLSKNSILLSGIEMKFDGEADLFGRDDKENDEFMNYDWGNIEDLDDLDKMFRSNNSIFGNEMIENTDIFLSASADLISSTSQSIPVPDIPMSKKQAWEEGSSSQKLGEYSNAKENPSQKGKADLQNKGVEKKNREEKGKTGSSEGLNNSWYDKNQQTFNPRPQTSTMNTLPAFQSQSMEQPSSAQHAMIADYGYPPYQFQGIPFSPQFHVSRNQHKPVQGGFKAHLDSSKHPKGVASKSLIMTPREKIEKLRRRQQIQAMLAIQKQRERYNRQISGHEETPSSYLQNSQNQNVVRSTTAMETHASKLPSSNTGYLADQEQSQMVSSSLDGRSVQETIYYQLQDVMGKLDKNVRLSICDSLYRLAKSAMERQNVSDRSSTNKTHKQDEISADEESNNQHRYSRMLDAEAVTNPIDRIVAHLLFHNPSGSSLIPFADGDMAMATSM